MSEFEKQEKHDKNMRRALFILNAANLPHKYLENFRKHEPSALWENGADFWKMNEFPEGVCERLQKIIETHWVEQEIERMRRTNTRFISIDDEAYPRKLKDIYSPPIGLYVRGKWCGNESAVGVVGTRRASHYGKRVAHSLGDALAKAEQVVISGGAAGIDGAVHLGCVEANGKTIAVLGNGIDVVYPQGHRSLFEKILENGALVSEYPFGTHGDYWRFPERNRIIVGLSERIVVVEAPEKSGAMITARVALEEGREIWSVPGHITDNSSRGTNGLLRDGAHPLTDISEFVETINGHGKQMLLNFEEEEAKPQINISEEESRILEILRERGQRTLDDISAGSGFNLPQIQFCLTSLIASNLIFSPGPGRFSAT